MNVEDLVRGARPHAPAGWARSIGGQRVLNDVVEAAPAASNSGRTGRDPGVTRRPGLRWSLVGTGVVGAAAAVALVAPSLVSAPDTPADGPPVAGASPGSATPVGARDILLAAATRAEQAPAATGKYWHVKTMGVVGPLRVGTEPNVYRVVRRTVEESWDARDAKGASWTGRRDLGARPQTAADEKAWRADGSPATWTLKSDGQDVVLSTRPDAGELSEDIDPPRYLEDLGQLTLAQVGKLPADQQALRAWVTDRVRTRMGHEPGSVASDRLVFGFLGRMLLDTPAAPKVRAAAFRILADLPGVRSLGTVRDDSGRSGQAVEFADETGTVQLIIDATTHLVLAEKYSSGPRGAAKPAKEGSSLVLTAQWSDAPPQVPSIPQQ